MGNGAPRWARVSNVSSGLRHNGRANRRAILFVHGFTGRPEDTWRADGASNSFPELVWRDPDLNDYDVFTFFEQLFGDCPGLFGSGTKVSKRHNNAALRQQLLGLKFVDFHSRYLEFACRGIAGPRIARL